MTPRLRDVSYAVLLFSLVVGATVATPEDSELPDRFRQLEELLPTPNEQRTASGAPGHEYWQQQVDYIIDVTLDDENQHLYGSESITYRNHSPDALDYLWLQLDANLFLPDSHAVTTGHAPNLDSDWGFGSLDRIFDREEFNGGTQITAVTDATGAPLPYTINQTMMRVDLPQTLTSGASVGFTIEWNHAINDHDEVGGRGGYERFDDGNVLYEMAQWFPRLAAYTDVNGWQHKQFLGRGEFTLEFGDYVVRLDVPADHVVTATGVLQNPNAVLTREQMDRLDSATDSDVPVFVITPEEAEANEPSRSRERKTWVFAAENVRDFAWASSRKFIWDALEVDQPEGDPVLCMSFYPKEGEPLWSRYSTHAIAHTIDVYGKHAFPYPYPVAISVNGPVGGMEYPMICFNGPRPEEDGTYSSRTKYGLIGVVIHEVGHNWFPMIVNSDERQWTWMDEGLNTFVQFLAEQTWEDEYPSRRGHPQNIVGYMSSENIVPIMTNSESLQQFGSNAYSKPATALNILRESVMGRELFDFAFRTYSTRWMFKRPQPADFFRSMEDASAVDLDWFWRGWFYTTDACDVAITGLKAYTVDTRDPTVEKARRRAERDEAPLSLTKQRNAGVPKRAHRYPELLDFYNEYDELDITADDIRKYEKLLEGLEDDQSTWLESELRFYVVDLVDEGGLAMPVVLQVDYEDGSSEELRIPAEIWRRDAESVSKLIVTDKVIASLTLDPHLETADIDLIDNFWPRKTPEERVTLTTRSRWGGGMGKNPMQEQAEAEAEAESDG